MSARLQSLPISHLSRLRQQELVGRRMLRLIFLGLMILSLAGLLYLTQASAITTATYEIQELQREKQHLLREQGRLRAEIASLTTPTRIQARAEALGFQPSTSVEFLAVTQIPAIEEPMATRALAEAPPSALESLLTKAGNWLQITVAWVHAPPQAEAGALTQ